MIDHMIVGQSITVRRNEEAGTLAGDHLVVMLHAVGGAEAETLRKLVERRLGLIGTSALVALGNRHVVAIAIDLDADRYHSRFDLGYEIAEARRILCGGLSRLRRRKTERPVTARPDDEHGHAESGDRRQQREATRFENFSWC